MYCLIWHVNCCFVELKLLLIFWLLVTLTWLWAGLHMAYQLLWLLVMFCIFNISLVGAYFNVIKIIIRLTTCLEKSTNSNTI